MTFSCCPPRRAVTAASDSTRHSSREVYEKQSTGSVDSLARMPAPVEHSTAHGLTDSRLETSLAWSRASVDSLGRLQHEIGNKDSLPVVIRERWRDREVVRVDTLEKIVTVTEVEQVPAAFTAWQRVQLWCGRLLLLGFVVFIIYRIARWKFR